MFSTHLFAAQDAQPVIELDGPSDTPHALFVQTLLEHAYQRLGVTVSYREIPLGRSFVEANKGQLDGLRARVAMAAEQYPNLVRVPYPLFEFKVLMIANRRVCGACLPEDVMSIAAPRGFRAFDNLIKTRGLQAELVRTTNQQTAFELLQQGRVQAAVVSDTNLPSGFEAKDVNFVMHTLDVLPDFHYVNIKHAPLVPELMRELVALDKSGVVASLRAQYNVGPVTGSIPTTDIERIVGISASWVGFTDSDNGTYWKLLDKVYVPDGTAVKRSIVNWKRAKQLFYQGEADILVGAYGFEAIEGTLRSDLHIDYEWAVSAFAKNKDALTAWFDKGDPATACYLLGYDFKEWLPKNIETYETESMADCVRLFEADRVDLLMNYAIDLPPDFLNKGYYEKTVASEQPLFVVFQNTDRGRRLKKTFERRIAELIRTDQLKWLFPDEEQYALGRFRPGESGSIPANEP